MPFSTPSPRKLPDGVIVHADWGSQDGSAVYQALLAKHKLVCSVSKKGECYDNAAMESWNHSFKVEAVHGECGTTRTEAKQHTFMQPGPLAEVILFNLINEANLTVTDIEINRNS